MGTLKLVHILAGSLGLLSGFVALYASKGQPLHRRAGIVFVSVMLAMALTGSVMAVIHGEWAEVNLPAGITTAYLVVTGFTTIRPPARAGRALSVAGMAVALGVGVTMLTFGVQAIARGGERHGIPFFPFLLFGFIGTFAAIGDLRMMRSAPLTGATRLNRHLWRMSLALFIAAMSFFIGQADVIPKAYRIRPVLALPVVAVLITMLYWVWRVRVRRSFRGTLRVAPVAVRSTFALFAALALAAPAFAQSQATAQQRFEAADYGAAKREYTALQLANPRDAAAAYHLGRIAALENDWHVAVGQLERAVRNDPDNALYHYELGAVLQDGMMYLGLFRIPVHVGQMVREWNRAVTLDPDQLDARMALVRFYAHSRRGLIKARVQAREIAKRDPMRGAIATGVIAKRLHHRRAEEAAYQAAIVAAPDSAAGYFELSRLYRRQRRPDAAFATLQSYARRHPENTWAMYEQGRLAGRTGQKLDRGEDALRTFLARPPADASVTYLGGAHYWLGRIAQRRGTTAIARAEYQTAVAINPHSAARHALAKLD